MTSIFSANVEETQPIWKRWAECTLSKAVNRNDCLGGQWVRGTPSLISWGWSWGQGQHTPSCACGNTQWTLTLAQALHTFCFILGLRCEQRRLERAEQKLKPGGGGLKNSLYFKGAPLPQRDPTVKDGKLSCWRCLSTAVIISWPLSYIDPGATSGKPDLKIKPSRGLSNWRGNISQIKPRQVTKQTKPATASKGKKTQNSE